MRNESFLTATMLWRLTSLRIRNYLHSEVCVSETFGFSHLPSPSIMIISIDVGCWETIAVRLSQFLLKCKFRCLRCLVARLEASHRLDFHLFHVLRCFSMQRCGCKKGHAYSDDRRRRRARHYVNHYYENAECLTPKSCHPAALGSVLDQQQQHMCEREHKYGFLISPYPYFSRARAYGCIFTVRGC